MAAICPRCLFSETRKNGIHQGWQRHYCKRCDFSFVDKNDPAPGTLPKIKKVKLQVECPKCSSTAETVKNGFQRGKQRYLCKTCNLRFLGKTPPTSESLFRTNETSEMPNLIIEKDDLA